MMNIRIPSPENRFGISNESQQTPAIFFALALRERFPDFVSGYVDVHAGALFLEQHEDA